MTPTGVHQWLPRGRGGSVAVTVALVVLGAVNFSQTDDVVGYLLGAAYVATFVSFIGTAFSYRVQADDAGLHVRGAWWRTTDVAWSDVADIRPRRGRPSRAQLVVVTRGGREIRTGLLAKDHEASLVEHWHARTGRESVPAA